MGNFNFSSKCEYNLNTSMTTELINLYGITTKFLVTEKIDSDDIVFGDYSHLKTDSDKIYDINMLPENSDDWDSSGYNFDGYGFGNYESIVLFAARSDFVEADHDEFSEIIGNLIVLPNNKIMEITDVDATVPGINNLFTYNDAKSVYKLTCKPYDAKIIDELDTTDISVDDAIYDTLDNYFDELMNDAVEQDIEAEVTEQVISIVKSDVSDVIVEVPYVNTDEDSTWGDLT